MDSRQRRHGFAGIDDNTKGDLLCEGGGFLTAPRDNREGPGNIVESALGERPRLCECGYSDAAGTRGELHAPDLQALVGLHVGAESHPELARLVGHALDIALESVEINDQRGCRQFVQFHSLYSWDVVG